jgi:hypothetical protein
MSTSDIHPTTTKPTTSDDPDAIREDIERTRNELAGTVDALQAKLDVKAQAKARLARAKDQATTDSGKPRPELVAGAVGAVLLVAGLVWWRRS